jgi:uncharacterized protein (TIGR03437 family)
MFGRSGAQSGLKRNVVARLVLAAAVIGWLAFTPQAYGQSVMVTVSTSPILPTNPCTPTPVIPPTNPSPVVCGLRFVVDGQVYNSTQTFSWAIGSMHSLVVATAVQPNFTAPTVYTFQDWSSIQGTSISPELWVVANAGVTQYTAIFAIAYSFGVTVTDTCGSVPCGGVPGTILLNGTPMTYLGAQWYSAGAVLVLTAVPTLGYSFTGWTPGLNQVIAGGADTITLGAPVTAIANFTKIVPVTIDSAPTGLRMVIDSVPTTAPVAETWGWGSVHNVAAITPQLDLAGNWWAFSSWTNGGAANQIYTVPQSFNPVNLIATFVPATVIAFRTSPSGLNLTVDGRSNWITWSFAWAAGTTHTFSAPATQTDAQGNLWKFTGWSNGGTAAQTLTVPSKSAIYTASYQQLGQLTIASNLPSVSVSVNGTSCPTPCTVNPPVGTPLTISAPASVPAGANSRQDLLGWSTGAGPGNLTIAAPASATTVTANYHLMNRLTTAIIPAGAGTWNLQPGSPDGFYDYRTVVNIGVSAVPGYQFSNWSGDLNGIAPFGAVLMSQPRSVTALFRAVPYLPSDAVTNGAGPTPSSAVAPGSAISIFGANLADQVQVNTATSMPQTLDGVTVSIGGRLLPLYFVSPGQINAQLPADVPLGPSILLVTTPEQVQLTTNFTIAQDAPGLFTLTSNGKAYAIAFHPDGTLVTEASPAKAGEVLTLCGTGFGPTTPARPEGEAVPSSPSYGVNDPVGVQVGTASFQPQSAYAMPGAVGIDIVQFALGSGAPSGGDSQLTVTVNQVVSNTVLLPIQ